MERCRSSRGRQALAQEYFTNFHNPVKPEYIEPFARCAPGGVPKSFTWHGYEIRQYPGYVLFLFNSGTRIVHLDWQAASARQHQALERGFARPLGRQHARRRRDEQQREGPARPQRRVLQRQGAHRRALHLLQRRQALQLRRHDRRIPPCTRARGPRRFPIGRYGLEQGDEADGWHYEGEVANRPGKPPLDEYYERICVENNGGLRPGGHDAGPMTRRPEET